VLLHHRLLPRRLPTTPLAVFLHLQRFRSINPTTKAAVLVLLPPATPPVHHLRFQPVLLLLRPSRDLRRLARHTLNSADPAKQNHPSLHTIPTEQQPRLMALSDIIHSLSHTAVAWWKLSWSFCLVCSFQLSSAGLLPFLLFHFTPSLSFTRQLAHGKCAPFRLFVFLFFSSTHIVSMHPSCTLNRFSMHTNYTQETFQLLANRSPLFLHAGYALIQLGNQ